MQLALDRTGIAATHDRIRAHVRRTPILDVDAQDFELTATRLCFKLELLQRSGSFKVRGAFANLLLRPVPGAGVVAASGGNHGAAVAFAAQRVGVPATIFVPTVASAAKRERIERCGARLVVTGDRYADALAASEVFVAQTGAMPIHAFEQHETLLGQGTLGLEWEAQAPDLDTLLVAVGGGGLVGGIAAWYAGRIRIVPVEPAAAPTLHCALQAGRPVDAEAGGIAADSLAPRRVGALMFAFAQKYLAPVVLVSDEAIVSAQRALWDVVRVVAEPGGAAAFAALQSGGYRPRPGERVGVLVCGGNSTAVAFSA